MFRDGYVLAILKDENGKTIGAKIRLDNKVLGYTSNEISQLKRNGLQLINAVITSDGFVRAKEGKLPVEIFNTKPTIIEQRDISNANKLLNSNIIDILLDLILNLFHVYTASINALISPLH